MVNDAVRVPWEGFIEKSLSWTAEPYEKDGMIVQPGGSFTPVSPGWFRIEFDQQHEELKMFHAEEPPMTS